MMEETIDRKTYLREKLEQEKLEDALIIFYNRPHAEEDD
jgi:hypothetical protein